MQIIVRYIIHSTLYGNKIIVVRYSTRRLSVIFYLIVVTGIYEVIKHLLKILNLNWE